MAQLRLSGSQAKRTPQAARNALDGHGIRLQDHLLDQQPSDKSLLLSFIDLLNGKKVKNTIISSKIQKKLMCTSLSTQHICKKKTVIHGQSSQYPLNLLRL